MLSSPLPLAGEGQGEGAAGHREQEESEIRNFLTLVTPDAWFLTPGTPPLLAKAREGTQAASFRYENWHLSIGVHSPK